MSIFIILWVILTRENKLPFFLISYGTVALDLYSFNLRDLYFSGTHIEQTEKLL
jgi:hypothetical protein